MFPWWCLGSWSARRPDGESWWGEVVLPRAVPCLGTGDATANTKMKPERDHLPQTEKAKAEAQRGGLSSLFFPGGIQCDEFSVRASATL